MDRASESRAPTSSTWSWLRWVLLLLLVLLVLLIAARFLTRSCPPKDNSIYCGVARFTNGIGSAIQSIGRNIWVAIGAALAGAALYLGIKLTPFNSGGEVGTPPPDPNPDPDPDPNPDPDPDPDPHPVIAEAATLRAGANRPGAVYSNVRSAPFFAAPLPVAPPYRI